MKPALAPLFGLIREQRAILQTYENWEYDFDAYQRPRIDDATKLARNFADAGVNVRVRIPEFFQELYAGFHHNLDIAERRLKIAASIGTPLDISDRPVAHDIRCLSDPIKIRAPLGNKQRARDNLFAIDFYDTCGHMPGVHVSKLSIPKWQIIPANATIAQVQDDFQSPDYLQVVVASFEDPADAVVYKLAV